MSKDKNKNSRTLINVIGIPLLLSLIYLGDFWFITLIFCSIFFCTNELSKLCNKINISLQIIWLYFFYILLFITHFIEVELIILNYLELLSLAIIAICLTEAFRFKDSPLENISITVFSIIWLGVFLNSIILIREIYGFEITLLMFLSVWTCDTVAFIIGSKFGVKKILPNISPNKTWIGSISGLISVMIFIYVVFQFNLIDDIPFTYINILSMGIIFGLVSQIGDAIESMIKREANVKDSGTILRGHGGMLDRMDSLILVSPCFYIFLKIVIG